MLKCYPIPTLKKKNVLVILNMKQKRKYCNENQNFIS